MIKKKIIAIILAAILVFAVIPMTARATDGTDVIEVANFEQFKENINTEGATLKLTADITMTEKVTIGNTVTIDGNGHSIFGQNNDTSVYLEIMGGTVTIQNVTISQFGGAAPTTGQWGAIKVADAADANTKLIVNGLKMSDFNRAGIDIRSGNFEITNSQIDCKNTRADNENTEILVKGILVGSGSVNDVEGTIKNVTIINSKSTYTDWASSGIEVWGGAKVTIDGCSINDTQNGIAVNNTYDQCGDIDVTIQNTTVNATNRALRMSGKVDGTAKANVSILSGDYTGSVVFKDKTDNETIALYGGKYTGEVDVENITIPEGYMLENIGEGYYIARVDNTELKELVAQYQSLAKEDYTTESYNNFETALSNSKKVLDDVNATKEEIAQAVTSLTNAYEALEKVTKVNVDSDVTIAVGTEISEIINNNEKVLEYTEQGIDVETVVDVKDTTPTAEERTTIENVVPENGVVAKYFDISVLIKNADSGEELGNIEQLAEKVKFTITLDNELKNVPEGYERTYQVIRMHNGVAEVLDTVLSADKNSIEFSTDKFSTYAISYVDTKIGEAPVDEDKPTEEPTDEQKPSEETDGNKDIVQTGDYIYLAIGIFAVVAIANVVYFVRKNRK